MLLKKNLIVAIGKICLSDWHNEFLGQSDCILRIAEQIEYFKDMLINGEDYEDVCDIVCSNINRVLLGWVDNTYVGSKKPSDLKDAFQCFFCSLYNLLVVMKESGVESMRCFAESALFHGVVYRYLGYSRGDDDFGRIEPDFDNIYVSWTKNKRVPYLESKLHGPMTYLTCKIFGENYGIDLSAFGIGRDFEAEVVFPTIKQFVINIQYFGKNANCE